VWAWKHHRVSLSCFLAECCKRRLNWGSSVLLYFVLFAFWVIFSLYIFLYCFVCQYQSSDWLWRLPPKWPRMCRVAFSIYVGAFCIVVVCWKVISRIYYCVNRSWSGRIILVELSKSNLLQVTVAYRNIMILWKDVVRQPNAHRSVSEDYLCSTHPWKSWNIFILTVWFQCN